MSIADAVATAVGGKRCATIISEHHAEAPSQVAQRQADMTAIDNTIEAQDRLVANFADDRIDALRTRRAMEYLFSPLVEVAGSALHER